MATALVYSIEDISGSLGAATLKLNVAYFGSDVGGIHVETELPVSIDPTQTISAIASQIASAVQAKATSLGFTVPTGSTVLPSFSKV